MVRGVAISMEMSLCCLGQTEISVEWGATKSSHGSLVMDRPPWLFLHSHEVDIYGSEGGVLTIVVFIYGKPAAHISLPPQDIWLSLWWSWLSSTTITGSKVHFIYMINHMVKNIYTESCEPDVIPPALALGCVAYVNMLTCKNKMVQTCYKRWQYGSDIICLISACCQHDNIISI